jgi:hypothetical protein
VNVEPGPPHRALAGQSRQFVKSVSQLWPKPCCSPSPTRNTACLATAKSSSAPRRNTRPKSSEFRRAGRRIVGQDRRPEPRIHRHNVAVMIVFRSAILAFM